MATTTNAKVQNVNSLSANDKNKLKNAIGEINDSLARMDAERELQKEIINKLAEEIGLDKKLIRRMAKAYYKANFNNEVEDNKMFEEFYDIVINGKQA